MKNTKTTFVKFGSLILIAGLLFLPSLANALTLGNIGREDLREEQPEGDDESHYEESAKHVNYIALRDGGDGTMFYDKDNDIVVIKVNGVWMQLRVKKLPKHIQYDF